MNCLELKNIKIENKHMKNEIRFIGNDEDYPIICQIITECPNVRKIDINEFIPVFRNYE